LSSQLSWFDLDKHFIGSMVRRPPTARQIPVSEGEPMDSQFLPEPKTRKRGPGGFMFRIRLRRNGLSINSFP
jgi:hypothetical protein